MTAILPLPPPPPPPRYRLTRNLTTARLRLGQAAVIAVLAGLAAVVGMVFPGGDAAAQGFGGYTYTARICQEYGQQPRWYNVRDGQAAYNGGNSDSGWLLVLERGGGTPARYVGVSPDLAPAGTAPQLGTHFGDGVDFIPQYGASFYLSGPWRVDQTGNYAKIRNNGDDSDYVRVISSSSTAINRYNKISAVAGGQFVRWANMAWCRSRRTVHHLRERMA